MKKTSIAVGLFLWVSCMSSCSEDTQVDNQPPKADFTIDIASPKVKESVSFTDASSDPDGKIVTWVWNFGDGDVSTDQNPTHAYTTTGKYKAVLTATDDGGASSEHSKEIIVIDPTADNVPPKAKFIASIEGDFVQTGKEIVFTDASSDDDGSIKTHLWDFGDGTTSTDQNPTHTYINVGEYTISLKVTDNLGGTAETTLKYKAWGLVWSFAVKDEEIRSPSPALAEDGTVYIGSDDDFVYAINPNGSQKWAFQAIADIEVSPSVGPDGTVYVGSQASGETGGKLYALNPSDGSLKWDYVMGAGDPFDIFYSSPAFGADGSVYIGSRNDTLYSFDSDGKVNWKVKTTKSIRGTPAVGADGSVFVVNDAGDMYSIKGSDGKVNWTVSLGKGARDEGGIAIGSDGTLYVGTGGSDDKLHAINPSNGDKKWSFQAEADVLASPVIGKDGTLYVGSRGGKFYAIGANGTEKWSKTLGASENEFRAAAAIGTDGTIYIGHYGADNSGMHALDPANGKEKLYFACGRIWSSPAIKSDVVYFGSFDGNLYAVNMLAGDLADSPWPMRGKDLKHSGRAK